MKTSQAAVFFLCAVAAIQVSAADALLSSQSRGFDSRLAPLRLHVDGNRLVNAAGQPVLLRGVNIASLEWSNQGEHMREALDHAAHAWKANLIRLPLAQDRWFGKSPGQHDGGDNYRQIVDRLADACAAANVYLDLDLHWSGAGKWAADGGKLAQHQMPDAHSGLFWRDVATRYKNHPTILFGLYNEPHDVSWSIWRDGGTVTEKPGKRDTNAPPVVYEAVGLQKLYEIVRAAGAANIVTVSGLDWGYDLRGVLQGYAIAGTNIVYETHPYPSKKDWDKSFGQVSRQYAVFMGEWGGGAKDLEYGQRLMAYAREHELHWTAWCFHPSAGPQLLKNWSFEPTPFGQFVKDSL